MLDQVNGLPAHVLLVHAVVVLLPLTALLVAASAVRPQIRRRAGIVLPALAVVTLLVVPLTLHAGDWLQARVPDTQAVREHAELGDSILPIALALTLLAVVLWWRGRLQDAVVPDRVDGPGASTVPAPRRGGALTVGIAVVSVLVALGAVVQVVRVGDSGAQAAWKDKLSAPHAVVEGG